MKHYHINRLLKLARHLKYGKLGHKKFNFDVFNENVSPNSKNHCGTTGCAIGECPIIFPRDWYFSSDGYNYLPSLRNKEGWVFLSASIYFGITNLAVDHLFSPENQNIENFGGKWLGENATKTQVANNILAFLNKQTGNTYKIRRHPNNYIYTTKNGVVINDHFQSK